MAAAGFAAQRCASNGSGMEQFRGWGFRGCIGLTRCIGILGLIGLAGRKWLTEFVGLLGLVRSIGLYGAVLFGYFTGPSGENYTSIVAIKHYIVG